MSKDKSIPTDVYGCARCGKNHKKLIFNPISNPAKNTHWAMCPVKKEPIMMRILSEKD